MRAIFAAVLALALAPAAAAASEPSEGESWRGSARQALEELGRALDTLEGMVERLPSYGLPYLDKDGDIVIPRREAPAPRPEPGEPEIVEI